MPTSSPRTAFPTGWTDPLAQRIGAARAVLIIEKILPRLWPAAGFAGFYLALALTGLFEFTPWPMQALLLAATITASALSLADGFADFLWPRHIDAERRFEIGCDRFRLWRFRRDPYSAVSDHVRLNDDLVSAGRHGSSHGLGQLARTRRGIDRPVVAF
jgi:hypothetical protein